MSMQDLSKHPKELQNPVWYNGEIVPWNQALIHVFTHIVNYGSGVFEGIRVYETKKGSAIFHLDEHLDRLTNSIKSFGLGMPFTKEELAEGCKAVTKASGQTTGYLRPQVYFGLTPKPLTITAIDVTDAMILYQPLGSYRNTKELKIVLSKIQRIAPAAGDIEAKVIGFYTNSHYNHQYAHNNGADDAIMLDVNGNVAEASSSNVFVIKDNELFTPKTGYILKGITRASILELAENELHIQTHEVELTPDDLKSADEIFLTGTAAEIDPVVLLDGQAVGSGKPGEITQKLSELYRQATHDELPAYSKWLTYL